MYLFLLLFQLFNFNFQEGDILFQDCNCGEMCDAIEDVTTGIKNARFSHVAMVILDHDTLKVIEANIYGVKIVELHNFLNRYKDSLDNPTIAVGRLEPKYRYLIPKATQFAKSELNKPYDTVFLLNNDVYYCSELIYESFKYANHSKDFFKLNKMTFKKPNSSKFHTAFKSYYNSISCPIPEGKLGINPGAISRDKRLKVTFLY